jgi:hypothetical protein
MSKLKLIILCLLTPLMLISAVPHAAHAFDLFGDACNSTQAQGGAVQPKDSPTCQQKNSEGGGNNQITGPKNIINTAAGIIALVTGLAAVVMIIISGFTMITSAGNAERVTSSRRRLVAAIIGLVIVVLAWTLIRFVTDKIIQ